MKSIIRGGRGTLGRLHLPNVGTGALAALAAAVSVAGIVAAPSASATTRAPSATTITWWASPISTSGPDLRQALINAFEKTNPGIRVNLETAPTSTDTNRADLVTTISGGAQTPDVFMGDVIWPGQFGAHGLALPLSKYLPKSFFSRFASGLVAGASYKGQVYAVPFFQDQGFLYYRKDLLAADHMSVPKTWEQLASDAVTLVKQGQVKYGFVYQGASYEGGTCDFTEYYADTGGEVLNSAGTASVLNVSDATKALTFLRGLITSGASPSAVTTFEEPQAMAAFQNGQAAFMRNWDYAWAVANTKGLKSDGKVGVAPLPTFAAEPYPGYSSIGGWDLYINPHSADIKADITFINFLTGTQAQAIEARPPFSEIPTNASVRDNPAIKSLNPPFAVLSRTKLVPRPAQNPNYPRISQAIYANYNSALAGSESPRAAAEAMANEVSSVVGGSSGL
jgi:multiple sugar transport system substrate-binding protein